MAARFLLDTNILIYIRRRRPARVLERFRTLQVGEATLSVISYGELLYGAQRSQEPQRAFQELEELAEIIRVSPLPTPAAQFYGEIRHDLEGRGELIGANDLWIAAHARAAELVLVTNNEREFRRVRGLQIENWIK